MRAATMRQSRQIENRKIPPVQKKTDFTPASAAGWQPDFFAESSGGFPQDSASSPFARWRVVAEGALRLRLQRTR
jgi:hypothetical protein